MASDLTQPLEEIERCLLTWNSEYRQLMHETPGHFLSISATSDTYKGFEKSIKPLTERYNKQMKEHCLRNDLRVKEVMRQWTEQSRKGASSTTGTQSASLGFASEGQASASAIPTIPILEEEKVSSLRSSPKRESVQGSPHGTDKPVPGSQLDSGVQEQATPQDSGVQEHGSQGDSGEQKAQAAPQDSGEQQDEQGLQEESGEQEHGSQGDSGEQPAPAAPQDSGEPQDEEQDTAGEPQAQQQDTAGEQQQEQQDTEGEGEEDEEYEEEESVESKQESGEPQQQEAEHPQEPPQRTMSDEFDVEIL